MGKVILVFPEVLRPQARTKGKDLIILPQSLLHVGTPLDRMGHQVVIVDQQIQPDWKKDLDEELARGKPVCLGISSMTGIQIQGGLEAAELLRSRFPDVPIVWGGVHPSLTPAQSLGDELVDIVVVGEGEETLPELVSAIESGRDLKEVPGLALNLDGKTVLTGARPPAVMDDLPDLAYHLFQVEAYKIRTQLTERESLPLLTSKGCKHTCAYCYNHAFNQRQYRAMRSERVLAIMKKMIRDYRLNAFHLIDDNFFQSRKRAGEIFEGILKEGLDLVFYNANCRVDYIAGYSLEDLALMKRAGIRELRLGIESGSDKVQKDIDKYTTFAQALDANRKLKEAGIRPVYNFMAGFPEEGIEDIRMTLKLMSTLLLENPACVVAGCSQFTPYPGTPLFERCVADGWVPPSTFRVWIDYDWGKMQTPHTDPGHRALLKNVSFVSRHLDPKFESTRLRKGVAFLLRSLFRRGMVRLLKYGPVTSGARERRASGRAV